MGKLYKSTSSVIFPVGFEVSGVNPIDDRMVVEYISDLTGPTTFTVQGNDVSYNGMVVTIKSNSTASGSLPAAKAGDVYVLVDKSHRTNLSQGWRKINSDFNTEIASDSDLAPTTTAVINYINNKVSSLWDWKGVAQHITPDNQVITVDEMTVNGTAYTCIGYQYDLGHNIFYKWQSETTPTSVYYTKEGDPTTLYSGTASTQTVLYILNGDVPYFKTDAASGKEWENLGGEKVYSENAITTASDSLVNFYLAGDESDDDSDDELFKSKVYTYIAETFTQTTGTITSTGTAKTANSDNNGHVYQIGDKEYASNGLIWVELGSPKNNWIIL